MWILRFLGPIKFCKGPIKISNDPLKFGNLHVFEWDMGHWPGAHHHFGLGLSLDNAYKSVVMISNIPFDFENIGIIQLFVIFIIYFYY